MDSFYGGKQGISFIIKDKFKSIEEMEHCFGNGYYPKYNNNGTLDRTENNELKNDTSKPYRQVWYGEYCIIDTDNKNDKDNGKVFRRTGYHGIEDKPLDWPHAEYIGQIVGPAGGIPNVTIDSITEIKNSLESLSPNSGEIYYWNGNSYTDDWNSRSSITPKIDSVNAIYQSGKSYKTATPAFKYNFYTFQDNKKDSSGNFPIATIGIGFEIPYVDFDIESVEKVAPNATLRITDLNAGNLNADFYHNYKLEIPAGPPGPYLNSISIITPSENSNYYTIDQCEFSSEEEIFSIPSTVTPVNNIGSTKITVGKLFYYNSDPNNSGYVPVTDPKSDSDSPAPADFYLWDVKEIKDVALETDTTKINNFGEFKITYTTSNDDPISFNLPLLRKLEVKYEKNENTSLYNYNLYAYYGQNENSEKIGVVAPSKWGVWATKLTFNTETRKFSPEGPLPDSNDQIDKSYGNLGFYPTLANGKEIVEFYYWNVEKVNNEWTGTWEKIGEQWVEAGQLQIEGFDFTPSVDPPIFKLSAIPITATLANFEARPWK